MSILTRIMKPALPDIDSIIGDLQSTASRLEDAMQARFQAIAVNENEIERLKEVNSAMSDDYCRAGRIVNRLREFLQ